MSRLVRFAVIPLGYVFAVLVAVAGATIFIAIAIAIAIAVADRGAEGSFYRYPGYQDRWMEDFCDELGIVYQMALAITFPMALPGFLLFLFVAHRSGWSRWPSFAYAGALDAILAWLILSACSQATLKYIAGYFFFPASLVGGFLGGCAYWALIRSTLPRRAEAASP